MARSVRRATAPTSGDLDASPSGISLLASLLRKLEQTDFVHEERWSTLQQILSGIAHRIESINRKVDALVEWQLTFHRSALTEAMPIDPDARDDALADPDRRLSESSSALLQEIVDDTLSLDEMLPDDLATEEPLEDLQVTHDDRESSPGDEVVTSAIDHETLDWNRRREQLLKSFENEADGTATDARRGPTQNVQNASSVLREQNSRADHSSNKRQGRRKPSPTSSSTESRSTCDDVLNIDSVWTGQPTSQADEQTDFLDVVDMESSNENCLLNNGEQDELDVHGNNSTNDGAKVYQDVESLREQLVQAIRQSEMELSIMRAQMSQERARLEQMEAEIRQREKNLMRQADSGKDRQASRLKNFLKPNEGGNSGG